jgi:hypothetical protein
MPPHRVRVVLGDPVVVSQGPAEIRSWGPWQFPTLERCSDDRLHLTHHLVRDSAKDYGLPVAHAVSTDDGSTWARVEGVGADGGLILPNGDHLRNVMLRPRPIAELRLPEHALMFVASYGRQKMYSYRVGDLPAELCAGWQLSRLKAGGNAWVDEAADVRLPGELRRVAEDVLVFPWFYDLKVAPDGSLWGLIYDRREHCKTNYAWHPIFLRSTDNGRSWVFHSEILPAHDPAADPSWAQRDGFTEPAITFLPDGSVFCLMRTTDGNGPGPSYWARSSDGGLTWSQPRIFDDLGVCPKLLTLANGVTLAAYGRPGLYVRGTASPDGSAWGERVAVVKPLALQTDTCSYPDLVALDDRTALIAYSNFNWPDAQGRPCKTILVRTITAA